MDELYDVYIKSGIEVVKPLNLKVIKYKSYCYNVFKYIKEDIIKTKFN